MTSDFCIPSIVVLHDTKQSKLSLTNCFLCCVLPLRSVFKAKAPFSKSAALVSWCIRERKIFASNFSEKYSNFSANMHITNMCQQSAPMTISGSLKYLTRQPPEYQVQMRNHALVQLRSFNQIP